MNSDDKKNIKITLLNPFNAIIVDDVKDNQSKWLPELQKGVFELTKFNSVECKSLENREELVGLDSKTVKKN